MQILAFLTLFSIGFLVELKAEQELPVVFSRDPFAFLDKASKGTKDEYIRLYKDRETPRNELQKKRDELIAKESEEIQKLYEDQKKFEAERKLRQQELHQLRLRQTDDPTFQLFSDKANRIIHDDSLSVNQACDRIVLLKYHTVPQTSDRYLSIYGCKPLKEESKTLRIGAVSDFEI